MRYNLVGQKFGEFTVLQKDEERSATNSRTYWVCKCSCGVVKSLYTSQLTRGVTKSCGHLTKSYHHYTHGKSHTRIHNIWCSMKARCYNESTKNYKNYGGRGICVCDEWKNSFQTFYDWAIKAGYNDTLTIDRIDVNGNYCPENCRWATKLEQARNKRNLIMLTIDGVTMPLSYFAEQYDLPYFAVHTRYAKMKKKGSEITPERLFRPLRKCRPRTV